MFHLIARGEEIYCTVFFSKSVKLKSVDYSYILMRQNKYDICTLSHAISLLGSGMPNPIFDLLQPKEFLYLLRIKSVLPANELKLSRTTILLKAPEPIRGLVAQRDSITSCQLYLRLQGHAEYLV